MSKYKYFTPEALQLGEYFIHKIGMDEDIKRIFIALIIQLDKKFKIKWTQAHDNQVFLTNAEKFIIENDLWWDYTSENPKRDPDNNDSY